MQHGGRRPGAGRPRKSDPVVVPPDGGGRFEDPLTFLLAVLGNPDVKLAQRIAIAQRLMPYMHHKVATMGKKERAEAASSAGRFAVRDAPNAVPDWPTLLERN